MRIVVIGGTGLVGSRVIEKLKQRGEEAVAAAPGTGVDTVTGKGLAQVLAGAQVVVDVSNARSDDGRAAMDFFEASGRNLAAAAAKAGVWHQVALSIVGTERMQEGSYHRAKLVQERMLLASPVPHSLIRATQFFEFIRPIAQLSTHGGAVRLPPAEFQPMAADDVARAIVNVALGDPVNGTIEIAGPDMFTLVQAVRKVLDHDHDRRSVVDDPAATYFGVHLRERTLMPGVDARLGSTTLDWWLHHVAPPPKITEASIREQVH
jgi:uncharacterized protein YbjT (DUF2867 family)